MEQIKNEILSSRGIEKSHESSIERSLEKLEIEDNEIGQNRKSRI